MIRVRTTGHESFRSDCGRLWDLAAAEFKPNVVVGVRSGGWWTAEAMRVARSPQGVLFLPFTCRRPSTAAKDNSRTFKVLLKTLPYFALDLMRLVEYYLITLPRCREARKSPSTERRVPDEAELVTIKSAVAGLAEPARVLVVDDSLDSGATLLNVVEVLRDALPATARFNVAAYTVLGPHPVIEADFFLYRATNFRFPWSYDFHG